MTEAGHKYIKDWVWRIFFKWPFHFHVLSIFSFMSQLDKKFDFKLPTYVAGVGHKETLTDFMARHKNVKDLIRLFFQITFSFSCSFNLTFISILNQQCGPDIRRHSPTLCPRRAIKILKLSCFSILLWLNSNARWIISLSSFRGQLSYNALKLICLIHSWIVYYLFVLGSI